MKAVISLGSNIAPEKNLPEAVARLAGLGRVRAVSRVYQAPPAAGAGGPDYLNAAVELEFEGEPGALRARLRAVEADMGRVRPAAPGAPRPIDLDLVRVDDGAAHPDATRFAYVAVPLADLDPIWRERARGAAGAAELRVRADVALSASGGGASGARSAGGRRADR